MISDFAIVDTSKGTENQSLHPMATFGPKGRRQGQWEEILWTVLYFVTSGPSNILHYLDNGFHSVYVCPL